MAGVVKKPMKSGKYRGWFTNMTGAQKFFTGTTSRSETGRMAEKLEDEHRQIRLGYRDAPKSSDHHKADPVADVIEKYLSAGSSNGGRRGFGWSKHHIRMRTSRLTWWVDRLGLSVMGDLDGILPKAETALQELQARGASGKTLMNYSETIKSFCGWCEARGFLPGNPVKALGSFDTTPRTVRRLLTDDEVTRLLAVSSPEHALVYGLALGSGLRANEIRTLVVRDVNLDLRCINIRPEVAKNRKAALQPINPDLFADLVSWCYGKDGDDLVFDCPRDMTDWTDADLKSAGILKHTPAGRADFHGLRGCYISNLIEAGGTVKEVQTLARHSDPRMTMNTYAKTRPERLSALAAKVGTMADQAPCKHRRAVGAENEAEIKSNNNELSLTSAPARDRVRFPPPAPIKL